MDAKDCQSTLSMGHAMCNGGCNDAFGVLVQSQLLSDLTVSTNWGIFFVSVLEMRALLFGIYIKASDVLETPILH